MGGQKRTRRRSELEHCLNKDGGESKWSGDKEMVEIKEGELKQRERELEMRLYCSWVRGKPEAIATMLVLHQQKECVTHSNKKGETERATNHIRLFLPSSEPVA